MSRRAVPATYAKPNGSRSSIATRSSRLSVRLSIRTANSSSSPISTAAREADFSAKSRTAARASSGTSQLTGDSAAVAANGAP